MTKKRSARTDARRSFKTKRGLLKALGPTDRAIIRGAEKNGLRWKVEMPNSPTLSKARTKEGHIKFARVTVKAPAERDTMGMMLTQQGSPKNDEALIHRSAVRKAIAKGFGWQLSFTDKHGPVGHYEAKTLQDALDDATRERYAVKCILVKK